MGGGGGERGKWGLRGAERERGKLHYKGTSPFCCLF